MCHTVLDGGDNLQMWVVATSRLHKQSQNQATVVFPYLRSKS